MALVESMATGVQYGSLDLFPQTQLLSVPLPDGDAGIKLTIGFMRKAAQYGQRDPQIRQLALNIVGGVGNRDTVGELEAIYQWVKENIRFRGELDETVQSPEVTIKFGAGDCDDFSVLIAALAGALGFQWEFKTVGVNGSTEFTHVYPVVRDYMSGEWIPLDATVDEAFPGWEPSGVTRKAEWLGRMRNSRFRGLGQDQSAADQISEILSAAQPFVQSTIQAVQGPQPLVIVPGYGYPNYGSPPSYSTDSYPGTYASNPYATNPYGSSEYGSNSYPTGSYPSSASAATPPAKAPTITRTQTPAWVMPVVIGLGVIALFKIGETRGLKA